MILVTKLYIIKDYVITATIITWLPQIYYNFKNNIRISLPLLIVFSYTLNKIAIPIYIRGYENNIFHIKSQFSIVYILLFIIITEILIYYAQIIFGLKFLCPNFIVKKNFNIYKSKSEIINIIQEYSNTDCLICINPLILSEDEYCDFSNNVKEDQYDNSKITCLEFNNKQDNTVIDEFNNDINNNNNNNTNEYNYISNKYVSIFKCNFIECFNKIVNIIFYFHENRYEKTKEYMLTKCKHVFHSNCLKEWLKNKQECPICRSEIII